MVPSAFSLLHLARWRALALGSLVLAVACEQLEFQSIDGSLRDATVARDSSQDGSSGENPALLSESLMPLVRFEFEGTGPVVVVSDEAARAPAMSLVPRDTAEPDTVLENGGASFRGGQLVARPGPSTSLRDALIAAGSITVEIWAATENITQSGPARLVVFSLHTGERGFHIAQDGSATNIRFRSSATDLNGNKFALSAPAFVDLQPHHVVATFDGASHTARVFVDGTFALESQHEPDGVLNWDDKAYLLAFGDENGSRRRIWNGNIYRFALYDRVLSNSEIDRLYRAGHQLPE